MKRNICVSAVSLLILQGISAQDGLIGNAVRNLPLLAPAGTEIHYQGSIDKTGGNADWDWYLYEDANREWVVLDVDGPGVYRTLRSTAISRAATRCSASISTAARWHSMR